MLSWVVFLRFAKFGAFNSWTLPKLGPFSKQSIDFTVPDSHKNRQLLCNFERSFQYQYHWLPLGNLEGNQCYHYLFFIRDEDNKWLCQFFFGCASYMITKFPDIFLTKASCIWTLSCGGHEIHDVSVAGWPHISQQRAGRRLMGQPSRWATRSNWSRSAAGRCAGGRRPFNTFRWTFGLLGDRSHCVFNEVILSWIHLEFIVELVLSSVSRSSIRPAKYTHTSVLLW